MTEKYSIVDLGYGEQGIAENGKLMEVYCILDLLKENEQLLKEKIDAETKLYKANEELLMKMDYDAVIKQNGENEVEIINLKKENEQLKTKISFIIDNRIRVYQKHIKKCEPMLKLDDDVKQYCNLFSAKVEELEQLKKELLELK